MTSTPTSFVNIAPYYDLLMQSVPYEAWADYFELLCLKAEVNPRSVLDVCCGTGSVAEILAVRGYKLAGFDLSAPMIERAKQKAALRELSIDYWVANASSFQTEKHFNAAFSFFDSLNYITSLEDFTAAVIQVGKHIDPGGLFIFDLNTAYAFEEQMFTQKEQSKRKKLHYDWVGHYDSESRQIQVDMTFWLDGQEFHEVHRQRAHSDEEVRSALQLAGFDRIEWFESYTLDRPRQRSDRVHYLAQKSG